MLWERSAFLLRDTPHVELFMPHVLSWSKRRREVHRGMATGRISAQLPRYVLDYQTSINAHHYMASRKQRAVTSGQASRARSKWMILEAVSCNDFSSSYFVRRCAPHTLHNGCGGQRQGSCATLKLTKWQQLRCAGSHHERGFVLYQVICWPWVSCSL